MRKISFLFSALIIIAMASCYSTLSNPYYKDDGSHIGSCDNAVTDSSSVTCGGQTYRTVRIGSQTWMAENLNYNEGYGSLDNTDRGHSYNPAYGRLYNWKTARRVCPSGWHLPDNNEWTALINFVGSEDAGAKLKAKSGWAINIGTDDYGFSALPNVFIAEYFGWYRFGYWWSASEDDETTAWSWRMFSENSNMRKSLFNKHANLSVRCVQNDIVDASLPLTNETNIEENQK